jgi:DNA-binding transcriptional MerR regulator
VCYLEKDGKLALKAVRKPIALHDEQMKKRMPNRSFAASMCRAIEEQSETKRTLYEKQMKLEEEIRSKVEQEISEGAKVIPVWKFDDLKRCKDICEELSINRYYGGMTDFQKKTFKEAFHIAEHIRHLDRYLKDVGSSVKSIRSVIKGLVAGSEKSGEDPSSALGKAIEALESKSRELWCVTYVDYGDSVDGKARVMGLFTSKEEAHLRMKEDAEGYMEDLGLEVKVYEDSASVGSTDEVGCEYRIEKVKIPEVPEQEWI